MLLRKKKKKELLVNTHSGVKDAFKLPWVSASFSHLLDAGCWARSPVRLFVWLQSLEF